MKWDISRCGGVVVPTMSEPSSYQHLRVHMQLWTTRARVLMRTVSPKWVAAEEEFDLPLVEVLLHTDSRARQQCV